MPEKKFGEWRERERFFSSGECRRMEEELENGKNIYIDSQNRKKIFVGFACLVNDGH